MREINKTIYQVLKMQEPEEGINVSQIITDDLMQKQAEGEVKALDGASQLLDKKADELVAKKRAKLSKKVLKATGSKTRTNLKVPKEISEDSDIPNVPSEKVTIPSQNKKKEKTVKKIIKNTNIEENSQKVTKTNPLVISLLAIFIFGIAIYFYLELM